MTKALIRIACKEDIVRICEVLIRSIREICGPDYSNDPEILEDWCANKTPEVIGPWIDNPKNYFVVVELESYGVIGTALYRREESTVNLCHLAPEGLHQGLGTSMLNSMQKEASRLGNKEINLVSSITAAKFYRRNGFIDNGEPVYWGKVLGIPMRKTLPV